MRHAVLHALHISTFVLLWYVLSISLTLYNKWLFAVYGLRLPLLITALHFALKVPLARVAMACRGLRAPPLDWRTVAARIVPTGAATALDIALSNLSYLFISVTYYTIVKSAVPIWILLFSVWYGLQRLRPSTVLVIAAIVVGIALASITPEDASGDDDPPLRLLRRALALADVEDDTEPGAAAPGAADAADAPAAAVEDGGAALGDSPRPILGLVLVLAASLCGGFRWACTQVLLTPHAMHAPLEPTSRADSPAAADAPSAPTAAAAADRDGDRLSPLVLVYYISPVGALLLLPCALAIELPTLQMYAEDAIADVDDTDVGAYVRLLLLSTVGGALGFALLLAELRVVELSSGLTLSVAGIFKDLFQIAASAIMLGDVLTPFNVAGGMLCLSGMGAYQYLKFAEWREEEAESEATETAPPSVVLHRRPSRGEEARGFLQEAELQSRSEP